MYVKTQEVLRRLGVCRNTLRAAMDRTPEGARPWINIASERSPRYRWREDALTAWWQSLHAATSPQRVPPPRRGASMRRPRAPRSSPQEYASRLEG